MIRHHIYWYNLENLFDISTSSERSDFLKKKLKNELKGWTRAVLNKKYANLVNVISRFNNGLGPDILGVGEVENKKVVTELANKLSDALGRTYNVIHENSADKRGIDTALIYDSHLYDAEDQTFTLRIFKRNPTRDLFQIHLKTKEGNTLILILNHWPSRKGGVFESEPFRIMVAENLAYWIERIHEERGSKPAIVLMGDFNDNPFDRSIAVNLLSTSNPKEVLNATSTHKFFNPMFTYIGSGVGTHVYGNDQNILDQFMLSKAIVSQSASSPFNFDGAEIVMFDNMVKGDYNTPIRFGRPSSKSQYNPEGFSDHLPIKLILSERY